jgi:hypothetical protein
VQHPEIGRADGAVFPVVDQLDVVAEQLLQRAVEPPALARVRRSTVVGQDQLEEVVVAGALLILRRPNLCAVADRLIRFFR